VGLKVTANTAIFTCMSDQGTVGWVIMVGTLPTVRYYDVVIANKEAAIEAVRKAQDLAPATAVEASARLSEIAAQKFELTPGEIRRR
jgi:hypothetical protein